MIITVIKPQKPAKDVDLYQNILESIKKDIRVRQWNSSRNYKRYIITSVAH